VKLGLPVDILDTAGNVVAKSTISFVSPEVDNGIQGILAKATVPAASKLRNEQVVNARVTWSSTPKPTVPVLAVTQIGGQSFVYLAVPNTHNAAGPAAGPPSAAPSAGGAGFMAHMVAVSLGQTVGNNYPVLGGLKEGDQVIVSGLQFIGEGAPVKPMQPPPGKS
jgi:multidrug efflux pump subunit AcrA (membrane-fusion protein)